MTLPPLQAFFAPRCSLLSRMTVPAALLLLLFRDLQSSRIPRIFTGTASTTSPGNFFGSFSFCWLEPDPEAERHILGLTSQNWTLTCELKPSSSPPQRPSVHSSESFSSDPPLLVKPFLSPSYQDVRLYRPPSFCSALNDPFVPFFSSESMP